MSINSGMFAATVEECRRLLIALTARVEDHFDVSPEDVTLEKVGEADGVLYTLRQAAYLAGIGDEPL